MKLPFDLDHLTDRITGEVNKGMAPYLDELREIKALLVEIRDALTEG